MNQKIFIYRIALVLFLGFGTAIVGLYAADLRAEERPELSPELAGCLKEKMGEETFAAIKSGSRQPSLAEMAKGKSCFEQFGQPMGSESRPKTPEFSTETKTCLTKTLGADFESQFANVKTKAEGEALAAKAKGCFGGPGGERGQIPDTVKTCIIGQVGQAEAEKMFKGERPSSDSDVYKKLESAGCFKGFEHSGGRGPREDLSPDKKQCVESILGRMDAEPTEEQKQQVGEKCFGGSREGRPQLPSGVESCLKSKLGNSFMEKAKENLSEEERNAANECFAQNNFRPEGMSERGRPNVSEETRSCIERVSGQKMTGPMDLDDQTKNRLNTECFGGRADEITGEGGPRGMTREELDSCTARITGGAPGPYSAEIQSRINSECMREQPAANNPRTTPEAQACIDRIANDSSVQMTYEERQAKINAECFAAERYGVPYDPNQTGPNPDGSTPTGGGTTGTLPGGCQDEACVQAYCAANPTVCGPR